MHLFRSARLKLTLWYLTIIAFISLAFSFVIYRLQTTELTRFEAMQRERIETRIQQGMGLYQVGPRRNFIYVDQELIESVKKRTLLTLGIFNVSVIFIAGIFGYILAGRTLAPIQEMVDEQERFIGDASHELRTPLTVLRTSLEVYARSHSKTLAQANKLISNSLAEVIRLQKLSDSLLELSGHSGHSLHKLDLKSLVNNVILPYQSLAKKKKISLIIQVKSCDLVGDETSLSELISILVDNALKYTNAGGKITIANEVVKHKVVLSIKDTGIGIGSSDLPHIFDRFYRAEKSRTKGGYGLGLAIAKKIALEHGGTLTVSSKLGEGTTFSLTLPAK